MTTTYYIPPDFIAGEKALLPPEEIKHAVQVLRHKAGDEIVGVDGVGGWYRIELTDVGKRNVVGNIVERKQDVGESPYQLILAVGLLKNQKRFEVFAEKACELGVTRIIPLKSRRTQKSTLRMDRLNKILVAAMKQCGRSRLVSVSETRTFSDLLSEEGHELKLLCHESAAKEASFNEAVQNAEASDILVFIGPEGGFTDEEVVQGREAGLQVVSLGNRRLRTETAAITACAGIMLAKTKLNS